MTPHYRIITTVRSWGVAPHHPGVAGISPSEMLDRAAGVRSGGPRAGVESMTGVMTFVTIHDPTVLLVLLLLTNFPRRNSDSTAD